MATNRNPISKRLKEARLTAGISQKKLGIAAGIDEFVSSARMNQYETGKHTPDFLILKKIAAILMVPVAFFYAEDDSLAQAIKLFDKLNKNKRNKILLLLQQEAGIS